MVLHAEDRALEQAQALHHAVVEVDVADHRGAVRRLERLPRPRRHVGPGGGPLRFRGNAWRNCVGRFRGNVWFLRTVRQSWLSGEGGGEAVVVAGDVDPAGHEVQHRLVEAAVAVAELVGTQAERPGEDLAAQADAEHGDARAEHPAHRVHRVPGRGGVAGAVAEEHAVRRGGQDVCGAAGRGQHQDLAAPGREVARRGRLDAQVDRDHAVPGLPLRADGVRLGRADHPGQVGPGAATRNQHVGQEQVDAFGELLPRFECLPFGISWQHEIAAPAQRLAGHLTHGVVVFDQQDGFQTARQVDVGCNESISKIFHARKDEWLSLVATVFCCIGRPGFSTVAQTAVVANSVSLSIHHTD